MERTVKLAMKHQRNVCGFGKHCSCNPSPIDRKTKHKTFKARVKRFLEKVENAAY